MNSESERAAFDDREIADIVNRLRDTAAMWGKTQQLRERIAAVIVPVLKNARASSPNAAGAEGAEFRTGIEAVAKLIEKKANDYVDEFGHWEHDTGALSFGQGAHADVKRDYHSSLVELAEEVREFAKGESHA